jgi:hypothetical protein
LPVSALELEEKFAQVLRIVRGQKSKYPNNANDLARHFGDAERRVIYALLEEDNRADTVAWNSNIKI